MASVEPLEPLASAFGSPLVAVRDSERMDGAFQETAFTPDQVEKANILELAQLLQAPCQFLNAV